MSEVAESSQRAQLRSEIPPAPTTQIPGPISQSQDAPVEQVSFSSRVKNLNKAEKYWTWKAGLRALACVLNIIGIGAVAWFISVALSLGGLTDYTFASTTGWQAGAITVLCVSLIWCLLSILLPLFLKPARPLHPGIAVGIDLILWLAFLLVGLITIVVIYDVAQYGSDGFISDPSWMYSSSDYNGDYYYIASNDSWVYNVTSVYNDDNSYYNYTLGEWVYPDPIDTSSIVRDCTPVFASCQQQDQYVNQLWHEKPRRLAVSVLIDAVEWLNVLLHFTLFVWACVDTHRRNRRSVKNKEQIVADRIIADLESKGLVLVKNGVVQAVPVGQPEMATTSSQVPHNGH